MEVAPAQQLVPPGPGPGQEQERAQEQAQAQVLAPAWVREPTLGPQPVLELPRGRPQPQPQPQPQLHLCGPSPSVFAPC